MEPVNLSILVVNCKEYKPSYHWYFSKSVRYFCGTPKERGTIGYDVIKLINTSPGADLDKSCLTRHAWKEIEKRL